MEYFILKTASGTEETGMEYPQANMKSDYDFKAPDSIWEVNSNSFPLIAPNLTYFDIVPGARLTDFISTPATHGFVISPKVKDLLGEFTLVPHKFYPAIVKYDGEFYNYYWLHIVSDMTQYVDFKRTKFYVTNFLKKISDININSKDEMEEQFKELIIDYKTINAFDIYLIDEFLKLSLDLFIISYFDLRTYISEDLKSRMLKEKITGIEISKSNITIPVTS